MTTRRGFVGGLGAAAIATRGLWGQQLPPAATTRPNIAAIDRERILKGAAVAPAAPAERLGAESAEFLAFTLSVPALAAAVAVDAANAERYRASAEPQLKAWFVAEGTRLVAAPELGEKEFGKVTDLCALAEVCVALPFLGLDEELLAAVKEWFAARVKWLTENRTALLARDAKDHHGASWLLQTAAAAKLTGNDAVTVDCRHRFKTVTIRAEINAEGLFPHELTGENPFRNSLFTLDLLGGVCQLLSTQFDSVWDHELQDGPGMRSAVAKHAYYIKDRVKWPYPADVAHFNLLPGRRPTLVFAGRAYSQPDYVTLWRGLNPDPADPDILRTFPIRQPLLWLNQPKVVV
jgi:hypothetical protein